MSTDADAADLLRETSCLMGLSHDPERWTDDERRALASWLLTDARRHGDAAQAAAARALTPPDPTMAAELSDVEPSARPCPHCARTIDHPDPAEGALCLPCLDGTTWRRHARDAALRGVAP